MNVTEQKYKKGRMVFTHYDQAYEIIAPLRYECSGSYKNGPASGWVYECFPVNHRFCRCGPPCEIWEKNMLSDRPQTRIDEFPISYMFYTTDWPARLTPRPPSGESFRDFYLNYMCSRPKAGAQGPVADCNKAVREVLDQRGKQYTPAAGRSQVQAEMNDAVRKALAPFRPEGLPLGCEFIETQLAGKFTRALEQAWNGTYSGDNTLDFGGYSACLAAKISKTQKISEVVK